ncbi:MAG: hypothetical protein JWR80_6856 [Bradyrhizobium sp.]|nr:hypothetical protein [Bradyrhizobium sp.]
MCRHHLIAFDIDQRSRFAGPVRDIGGLRYSRCPDTVDIAPAAETAILAREESALSNRATNEPANHERDALCDLDAQFRTSLERYFKRKTKSSADIDDMVQEVFLRLVQRGGLDGLDQMAGYVFRTASAVLVDRSRRAQVRQADEHEQFDEYKHARPDFSPEHVLSSREELQRATAVLLELPERTRVIFVLHRLEGMPHRDVAARLGISVSAVEKHMGRAMARLIRRMSA